MTPQTLPLAWRLGWTDDPGATPTEWIDASVPGSVQTDWARAQGWPDPSWDNDLDKYRWMEDKHWVYEADYEAEASPCLWVTGVDHSARVTAPLAGGGARTWFIHGLHNRLWIEGLAAKGTIRFVVNPAPKHPDWTGLPPQRHHEARNSTKPPVSYGWDFHPRFVPLGLWQAPLLWLNPPVAPGEVEVRAELSDDLRTGTLIIRAPGDWAVTVKDPDGVPAGEGKIVGGQVLRLAVADPRLWWPHTHGAQDRYEVSFQGPQGSFSLKSGFRKVKLVLHEGSWNEMQTPVGPGNPPIALEVNGQRVFALGTNIVNMDLAPGRVDEERMASVLGRAKEAGFNLLRNWGGAPAPALPFFELCDDLGLMVWQEFPLACTRYDELPYIEQLKREAEELVRRLRPHPSLSILCGGNELFNSWSRMTEQDLALRTLDSVCLAGAPEIPFLKTSPIMGMGHGSYLFIIGDGRDVMEYMTQASCTAYTEFGVPSLASREVLDQVIPAEEQWPLRPSSAWVERHALAAWDGHPESWSTPSIVEDILGPMGSLDDLIEASRLLQCEGLRFIYEEARRQKPKASMALNWCFNDPWPTAANNSLLQWPDQPKPAFFAVKEACRPTLLSLRYFRSRYLPGDEVALEPWLLNESGEAREAVMILKVNGQEVARAALTAEPGKNGRAPVITVPADFQQGRMVVEAVCEGNPEWSSRYLIFLDRRSGSG